MRLEYHAEAAVQAVERLEDLAAAGPFACRRCGGPLSTVAGLDEDDGEQAAVTAVAECGVCGRSEAHAPMRSAEVRDWTRRRLALVRQRREAS